MNRRLFVLSVSLVGAFVLLVGVLRWGNAAAFPPLSPSSTPQRVGAGSGYFYDSGQRLGNSASWAVALGDLDGDGDLDAFVGNWTDGENPGPPQPNEVWLSDGRGRFVSNGQALGNEYTTHVALADLDGDSDLDAFTVNDTFSGSWPHPGGAIIWLNDGAGQFTDSGQLLGSNLFDWARVALGDTDSDGDTDALIADDCFGGTGDSRLWINQGDGTFVNSGQSFGSLCDIALADIDGDDDLDAVTAQKIFWNMGGVQGGTEGQFVNSGQAFGATNKYRVSVGDLDTDGDLDAFLGCGAVVCYSEIWFNNGAGLFTNSGQALAREIVNAVALADLDGDGDLDAFVAQSFDGRWTDNEDDSVWLNDGNGFLSDSYQSLSSNHSPGVALGDLNGDGSPDAFLATYVAWDWLNGQPGQPNFEAPNQVWLNKPQADLAIQQAAQVNGQTITYTLTYTNNGPDLVLGATITDTLNPALSNITVTSSGVVITPVIGANLAWQVAPLPAGSGGVIQVRGTFAGEIPGNVAEFAAAVQDPLPHNNIALAYALTVDAAAPPHNSFPIQQTSFITFTFSRAITPTLTSVDSFIVHGDKTGRYLGTFIINDNQLIWEQTAHFKPGENVSVYVDQSLTTAGGTTLLQSYQQQFQIGGGLPPFIGTGILTPTHVYTTTAAPMNVALGDLDGDGDQDAFIVSDLDWANPCNCNPGLGAEVWLNNGGQQGGVSGTFSNTGQSLGELAGFHVALGDVDTDGDLDAFVANYAVWDEFEHRYAWNNHNEIWLNDGQGFFTRSEQQLGHQWSYAVALGDVDGDHDLDAVVANLPALDDGIQFDGRNELWLNNGQGHFTHGGQLLGDEGGLDVSLGDLDNDGDLDAFIVYRDASRVWLNQGGLQGGSQGQFVATTQDWSVIPSAYSVELADLDNDDDLDAIITMFDGSSTQVWLNNGTGHFVPGTLLASTYDFDPDLGDLDGDGDIDAFLWSEDSGVFTSTVWLNDGSAQFTVGYQTNELAGFSDLGDLDGDGDLDVFSAGGNEVNVWLNVDELPIQGLQASNDGPTVTGQTTHFTATVTSGTHVHYVWNFGDGHTAYGKVVSHTYALPGNYTATVTASNLVSTEVDNTAVAVEDVIAGLAAANDSPTVLGQTTHFTATITAGTNVNYLWDFGDGQIVSGMGPQVGHIYATPGIYTTTVIASNSLGQLNTTTHVTIIIPARRVFIPLLFSP